MLFQTLHCHVGLTGGEDATYSLLSTFVSHKPNKHHNINTPVKCVLVAASAQTCHYLANVCWGWKCTSILSEYLARFEWGDTRLDFHLLLSVSTHLEYLFTQGVKYLWQKCASWDAPEEQPCWMVSLVFLEFLCVPRLRWNVPEIRVKTWIRSSLNVGSFHVM